MTTLFLRRVNLTTSELFRLCLAELRMRDLEKVSAMPGSASAKLCRMGRAAGEGAGLRTPLTRGSGDGRALRVGRGAAARVRPAGGEAGAHAEKVRAETAAQAGSFIEAAT